MTSAAVVRDADSLGAANNAEYEVLLRVPAKALCRLRLVCRAWRSLTSDPRFARAHSARHPVLVALMLGGDAGIHILDLSGDIVKRIRGLGDLSSYLTTHAGPVCVSTMALNAADADDLCRYHDSCV